MLDLLGVYALAAAVAPAAASHAALDSGAGAFRVESAQGMVDGAAGDELGDQEGQGQDAQQGGDHRQKSRDQVAQHGCWFPDSVNRSSRPPAGCEGCYFHCRKRTNFDGFFFSE
ncbi:hypothetical protein D9M71_543340 [compost metagenome]